MKDDNKQNDSASSGENKRKPSVRDRFMKAIGRSEEKSREMENLSGGDEDQPGIGEGEEFIIEPEMLSDREIDLEITPRKQKIRGDGKTRLEISGRVLVDGTVVPQQTIDFGLLQREAGNIHKISSDTAEFIAEPMNEDTVVQVEVLYRYGVNSIRKQIKIFVEGSKPRFAVIMDPASGQVRGNGKEQVTLNAFWSAFDGEYTIPCPALFEIVSGQELGELMDVPIDEENTQQATGSSQKVVIPRITAENRNITVRVTPVPAREQEGEKRLSGMFANPLEDPVEVNIIVSKADLKAFLECNTQEVDATGTESVLIWGYLADGDTLVPGHLEYTFENLLPEDTVNVCNELSEIGINPETIPVEHQVFFEKKSDCLTWALVKLCGTAESEAGEERTVQVTGSGMGVKSEPLVIRQLNPVLDLDLNKSSVKAGDLVIIAPYLKLPGGSRFPVTRKIYNPVDDPDYITFVPGDEIWSDEKNVARLKKQFTVMGNTAQFQAPHDLHDYHFQVHARIPYKNFILKKKVSIYVRPPEYRIRPLKKLFYEDEGEIVYEVLMTPVNQKDWMIEVAIEDESRSIKCPRFLQLLQLQKKQGVARGKYIFSKAGKPREKGGLIKISLSDNPEIFTVVRVVAPFQISLTAKLSRFKGDHLEQLGEKSANFQQQYNLRVKPGKPEKNEE